MPYSTISPEEVMRRVSGLVDFAREEAEECVRLHPGLAEALPDVRALDLAAAIRTRFKILNETTERDHVRYWRSNGAPVPVDCYTRTAFWPCPDEQAAACDRYAEEGIRRYREAQANLTPEQRDERAFEMRAAFGPGEDVVDLFTGESFET